MRNGAALPVVLFAITATSALAVGGTFVTRQLAASARAAQRHGELEPAAEQALVDAIASWDSLPRSAQLVGTTVALAIGSTGGARADVWVTRVTEWTYWLVAEANGAVRPPLRRRIGVLVRVSGGAPALVAERAWSELP
jgi:hypothetical protein